MMSFAIVRIDERMMRESFVLDASVHPGWSEVTMHASCISPLQFEVNSEY